MKIRLIGSVDLVRAWSAELERAYGIKGTIYPSRYNSNEVRVYFDLDDRLAAAVIGLTATPPAPAAGTSADVVRRPRKARKLKHGQ